MGFAPQDTHQTPQVAQNVAQQTQTTHEESDPAHNLIHTAMSIFGSGTVVIALVLGGLVMYKKFAKKWLVK